MIQNWVKDHRLFLFALLIIAGNFVWLMCFRKKLRMGWKAAALIAVLHDIIGYSAMRFLALIEVGGNFSEAADMRLFGAVFLLPLFYYAGAKYTKRDTALVMDVAAICLVVGLISGRLNCLCGGCCGGARIWGTQTLCWPLREIELLFYAGFMVCFCKKILHGQTHGEVYPVFMMVYGGIRFWMEWVRVEYTTRIGIFHLAHIWAIISFCVGASIYFEMKARRKRVR